jgi:hypothetical protein
VVRTGGRRVHPHSFIVLYNWLSIPDSSFSGCIFGRRLDSFHSQNNSFSFPARMFDNRLNTSLTISSKTENFKRTMGTVFIAGSASVSYGYSLMVTSCLGGIAMFTRSQHQCQCQERRLKL